MWGDEDGGALKSRREEPGWGGEFEAERCWGGRVERCLVPWPKLPE